MTIRGGRADPLRNWEPDAGATFLGAYGLRNPMVLWLLRKHPELLAFTPGEIAHGAQAPYCAVGHRPAPMMFRKDGWVCYRHDRPRRIAASFETPTCEIVDAAGAPVDALAQVGRGVDLVYKGGKLVAVELETPG
jgi:hypothetical protein